MIEIIKSEDNLDALAVIDGVMVLMNDFTMTSFQLTRESIRTLIKQLEQADKLLELRESDNA